MIPRGIAPGGLLILIDLSWWLNRAYFAAGRRTEDMARTVVAQIMALLDGDAPSHLAVAVDSQGRTWRHDVADAAGWQYKAGREPKPPEFFRESERVLDALRVLQIPALSVEGWEADDIFAAARRHARATRLRLVMLSNDKDLLQLVDAVTFRWCGGDRDPLIRRHDVHEMAGVWPEQIPDFLGITGDSCDKIPGVPRLGEVAAREILSRFPTIEAALDAPTVTGARTLLSRVSRLREHRAAALASKRLATLDPGCPLVWPLADLAVGGWDLGEAYPMLVDLELGRAAEELRECPKAPWPPEREPGEDDE